MLTPEQNEILTRTGPGTPMGELLRRYWVPILLSTELPEPNGDPVPVMALGERFVIWRDERARLVCFDEQCMHRQASLSLARCEGDGLRCLYHGWKFAADGTVIDVPNVANDDIVRGRLRAPTHPIRDAGGIVWVYLGPSELEPEFPEYAFLDVPDTNRVVTRTVLDCNWLQSVESHIDSSHFGILHQDWNPFGNLADTNQRQLLRGDTDLSTSDNAPTLKVEDTEFGFYTAAIRKARRNDEPVLYARIHAFALPWVALIPPGAVSFEVPMTDDRVNVTQVLFSPDHSVDPASVRKMLGEGRYTDVLSDGVQYFKGNAANRYLQDREAMRSGSFTGVDALLVEDLSVVVSMTSVVDRTKEHLVPADRAVMHMRRQLLKAAADLQEGIEPRHVRAEEARSIVPVEGVLREGEEWQTLLPHPPVVNPLSLDHRS